LDNIPLDRGYFLMLELIELINEQIKIHGSFSRAYKEIMDACDAISRPADSSDESCGDQSGEKA